MSITSYDAKTVSVIVNGVFLTGFAESMVEVEKTEDGYSTKVGAQGDVIRTKTNNDLGTITVTLLQTSPQAAYLDRLANSGQLVPVSVISAGPPKETSQATQAYVTKPATRTYANESEDREFTIQCLDLKMD